MYMCVYIYIYIYAYLSLSTYIYIYICISIVTHGNWLVTIGRSPLLWHGYKQTIIRHSALNNHLIRLLSDIKHIISISYSWGALHMVT